jgi:hypothetical protein
MPTKSKATMMRTTLIPCVFGSALFFTRESLAQRRGVRHNARASARRIG